MWHCVIETEPSNGFSHYLLIQPYYRIYLNDQIRNSRLAFILSSHYTTEMETDFGNVFRMMMNWVSEMWVACWYYLLALLVLRNVEAPLVCHFILSQCKHYHNFLSSPASYTLSSINVIGKSCIILAKFRGDCKNITNFCQSLANCSKHSLRAMKRSQDWNFRNLAEEKFS